MKVFSRNNRAWLVLFQALVSISLLIYLLHLVDWNLVQSIARSGLLYLLWPGPCIILIGLIVAAERWRLLLQFLGVSATRTEALYMYLTGNFYGVMLPGVLGGDAVRVGICIANKGGSSAALTSVVIERSLGLWGVALIGSLGLLTISAEARNILGWEVILIAPAIAVGCAVGMAILIVGIRWVEKLEHVCGRGKRVFDIIFNLYKQLRSMPFSLLLGTLLLSTLFQSAEILVFFYFGSLLHLDVSFALYLVVVPVVYLATVLPISLGGLGVREGILVWLFVKFGIPTSDTVLLAFLVYLNRIVVALIGGGAQLFARMKYSFIFSNRSDKSNL